MENQEKLEFVFNTSQRVNSDPSYSDSPDFPTQQYVKYFLDVIGWLEQQKGNDDPYVFNMRLLFLLTTLRDWRLFDQIQSLTTQMINGEFDKLFSVDQNLDLAIYLQKRYQQALFDNMMEIHNLPEHPYQKVANHIFEIAKSYGWDGH
ncbi:MAG: hypothetical protein LBO07_03570 [Coriobacteriales bacterium]|jgi:hypothetical protein|nr:hypothetical protein [Coriobacteriales bacterium]